MTRDLVDISNENTPDGALVRRHDIANYLKITPITWDRWVRKGVAPKRVTAEGVPPRWLAGDIRKFVLAKDPVEETPEE